MNLAEKECCISRSENNEADTDLMCSRTYDETLKISCGLKFEHATLPGAYINGVGSSPLNVQGEPSNFFDSCFVSKRVIGGKQFKYKLHEEYEKELFENNSASINLNAYDKRLRVAYHPK
ncbi:hypothetical protein POVWA2_033260 [Plasmodium ovale wallikeri]|uniref:Uncharacterized protein n=1 Tax=Plasmodium ovale wallikeri TaxID=864142 RepID=A0A1A8YZ04_PLAOA|nr:hypothetical protein POVWA1_034120 [Plasmodium ovale wallikeri]SBT37222.1 hypothetical protein POVWA2_033260 [Plasmodium ovale wallikeri]